MSDLLRTWPLAKVPVPQDRVVLATQGIRISAVECRLEAFDGIIHLACSDAATLENLAHQRRVAFTILGIDAGTQTEGSGMARVSPDPEHPSILVEPYRVSNGQDDTFELKLKGWTRVSYTAGSSAPSGFAFWYQAFRAVTLPLSALPVLVGASAAFSQGDFNPLFLLVALIGSVSAHFGANAAADYFDFKNGVDLSRALSSHLGALAQERVEPERILLAAAACFLVTVLVGTVLVLLVGWNLILFGFAGLLGAFFYTGRPLSYKYRAMGELALGTLMGPVTVMGSYYLQTLGWDWSVFLLSVSLGMLVSSVSLVNNLRDLPDDRAAGIRTLPMTLGISGTKKLYYFFTGVPYVLVAAAIFLQRGLWPAALVLASIPMALKTVAAMRATTDDVNDIREKSLKNPYPLNSIRLHTRFGSLLVIGVIMAGLLRILG